MFFEKLLQVKFTDVRVVDQRLEKLDLVLNSIIVAINCEVFPLHAFSRIRWAIVKLPFNISLARSQRRTNSIATILVRNQKTKIVQLVEKTLSVPRDHLANFLHVSHVILGLIQNDSIDRLSNS